jgi:hypothetical protein
MKKAFTLMEINLAILIMATGILSMISLYSLGFRESSQSREDVAGAAFAEAVISPLVMACSDMSVNWSQFREEWHFPSEKGWGHYLDENKGVVTRNPENDCKSVYQAVLSKMASCGAKNVNVRYPESSRNGLSGALVVSHEKDSSVVKIAFRATDKPGSLLAQPMYYTEVRFQGNTSN